MQHRTHRRPSTHWLPAVIGVCPAAVVSMIGQAVTGQRCCQRAARSYSAGSRPTARGAIVELSGVGGSSKKAETPPRGRGFVKFQPVQGRQAVQGASMSETMTQDRLGFCDRRHKGPITSS